MTTRDDLTGTSFDDNAENRFLSIRGKRFLVTGASGFLGSHLCRTLVEGGAVIHGVSRAARANSRGIEWHEGDVSDIVTVRRILRQSQPEVIYHFSGLVTAATGLELVLPTFHTLLASTVNLLTGAAEQGCERLILAGSLQEPMEQNQPTPSSPYAAAKWASSAYGRMFSKLYGLAVVNARIFMTYGPKQETGKVIPYVIGSLLRQEPPKISSGKWEADWIYVDDVIEGLVAAAVAPAAAGASFDLGSGTLVSTRLIVEHLVDLTGARVAPEFGAIPDRPAEPVCVADLAQAQKSLGWRPRTTLREGLQRTVDWHRQRLGGQGAPD